MVVVCEGIQMVQGEYSSRESIRAQNFTILLRPGYTVPLSGLFVVKLKAPSTPPHTLQVSYFAFSSL